MKKYFLFLLSLVASQLKAQSYEQLLDQAGQAINRKAFCAALANFKQAFTDTTKIGIYDYAYAAVAAANCQDKEQALVWLQKSQTKGLGLQPGEIESITNDSVFVSLHDSPQWITLLTAMQRAKDKQEAVKQAESQRWVADCLRRARLSAAKTNAAKTLPVGYALYFQQADTVKVPYLVYVPDSFDPAKPSSLLVYLHGGVANQPVFNDKDPQVANEPIFRMAPLYNAVVLYPFGRRDFGWVDQEKAFYAVLKMVETVKKRYPAVRKQIYLGGMSNGGTAAFWFATRHPDLFTGFYAFSPWPKLKFAETDYGRLSTGKPFISIHSQDDTVFPYGEVKAIYDQQQARAKDWKFETVETGGHGFIYGDRGPAIMQSVFDQLVRAR